MSTELDTIHEAAPMERVNTSSLEQLQQQAQSWSAAAQIADQLSKTDFAGPFKGKPGDLTAAILKGAELGIPAASIGKSIYVVHGSPALYGKTALAIALQHGYLVETIEDSAKSVTVRMTSPQGQEMEVNYTIERATQEGLVAGNKAQYSARPSKMLYWKCIGELTDRMIPHLTGGMPVVEDWQQSHPVRIKSTRADRPSGPDAARAALGLGQPEPEPAAAEPEPAEEMSTVAQQKKLAILLGNEGLDSREDKLGYLAGQFGREFTTSKELTTAETSQLIDFLATEQAKDGDQ